MFRWYSDILEAYCLKCGEKFCVEEAKIISSESLTIMKQRIS